MRRYLRYWLSGVLLICVLALLWLSAQASVTILLLISSTLGCILLVSFTTALRREAKQAAPKQEDVKLLAELDDTIQQLLEAEIAPVMLPKDGKGSYRERMRQRAGFNELLAAVREQRSIVGRFESDALNSFEEASSAHSGKPQVVSHPTMIQRTELLAQGDQQIHHLQSQLHDLLQKLGRESLGLELKSISDSLVELDDVINRLDRLK